MRALRIIAIALLVPCFLQTDVGAQQEKQPNPAPTGLSLEVTYWKGDAPAYQVVPNNSWYARFRRLESGNPSADSLPVQAVNIAARTEGESVRVIVSVHVGKKLFERQDPVGSYLLRENERVAVNELRAFGLEPFEIALVRVAPKSVPLPSVTSMARSVEVINVQPVEATFPTCQLTLLNTSGKNISALYVETFVNGRRRTSGMPHNQNGETLIAAGATYEFKRQLNNVARASGGGYAPDTPLNQAVVIKTAVFEDGTYEGDAATAAEYRGFILGQRAQLQRLVVLYQKALESTESDAQSVLVSLREQVNALSTTAEPKALDKLLGDFPMLAENDKASVKGAVEITAFDLKKDALKGIDEFRKKPDAAVDKEAVRARLSVDRDKYQKWLNRLQTL